MSQPQRGRCAERPIDRAVAYFELSGVAELSAAAGLAVAMLTLRLLNIFRYRFDSDESQHLHVVWGWARGLAQLPGCFR